MSLKTQFSRLLKGLIVCAALGLSPFAFAQEARSDLAGAWLIGAPRQNERPLPNSLWAASRAESLETLFNSIPGNIASPTAQTLLRRVLSSPGSAPAGAADGALRERFEALGRLGEAEAVSVMSAAGSPAANDPVIAMFGVQAELALGRVDQACARARAAPVGEDNAFLLRTRAFCFAVEGDPARTGVALEVVRSAKATDPWLQQALPALAIGKTGSIPGRFESSLNASISLAGGFAATAESLEKASPLALGAAARAPKAPADLRYRAAILALRRGILDPGAAQSAIGAASTGAAPPPLAASLLAAQKATSSGERTRALGQALTRTENFSTFVVTTRLFAPALRTAPPSAELAAAAPAFARAMLFLGQPEDAEAWLAAAPNLDRRTRARMDLAAAIASGEPAEMAQALGARITSANEPQFGPMLAREALLVQALGAPAPPGLDILMSVHRPPKLPTLPAASLKALEEAANRGAIGETALLAAIAIAGGPERIDTAQMVQIIAALRKVGLEDVARQIVVEIFIA